MQHWCIWKGGREARHAAVTSVFHRRSSSREQLGVFPTALQCTQTDIHNDVLPQCPCHEAWDWQCFQTWMPAIFLLAVIMYYLLAKREMTISCLLSARWAKWSSFFCFKRTSLDFWKGVMLIIIKCQNMYIPVLKMAFSLGKLQPVPFTAMTHTL